MFGDNPWQKMPPYFCIVPHVAFDSECWKATNDTHGLGGDDYDIADLAKCQATCIYSSTCVAIDWEPSNVGKSCWLLTSTFTISTTLMGVITHYELNPACKGQSLVILIAFAFLLVRSYILLFCKWFFFQILSPTLISEMLQEDQESRYRYMWNGC